MSTIFEERSIMIGAVHFVLESECHSHSWKLGVLSLSFLLSFLFHPLIFIISINYYLNYEICSSTTNPCLFSS